MKKATHLILLNLLVVSPAVWAIPNLITYQGTLSDQGSPANSPPLYPMTFQLTDQSGNTPYSNVISNQVTVKNGLFSVQLNFQLLPPNTWDTISPYLKVAVNGQALSPTEPINATAYAIVSNTVVDNAITPAKVALGYGLVPTGSIVAYASATPPAGWLVCDGSALSRSAYSALFLAIGTTWGIGDGVSTFSLPDFRGRAPIGAGQGAGLSNRPLGQTIGEETHILTVPEMPSHSHLYGKGSPGIDVDNTGSTRVALFTTDGTGQTVSPTGGGGPHNNMQPSAAVNFIIKY